jgi:hypothetical protein
MQKRQTIHQQQMPDVEIHNGFIDGREYVALKQGDDSVEISVDQLRDLVEALNWQANFMLGGNLRTAVNTYRLSSYTGR